MHELELTILYTINTDLNTYQDFEKVLEEKWVHDEILMILTMEHENKIAELAPGTDIEIGTIHPQDDTFEAIPEDPERPDHFNDVSCELFIEYYVIDVNND